MKTTRSELSDPRREMWCADCEETVVCRFFGRWRCSQCGEVIEGRPPDGYELEEEDYG